MGNFPETKDLPSTVKALHNGHLGNTKNGLCTEGGVVERWSIVEVRLY